MIKLACIGIIPIQVKIYFENHLIKNQQIAHEHSTFKPSLDF